MFPILSSLVKQRAKPSYVIVQTTCQLTLTCLLVIRFLLEQIQRNKVTALCLSYTEVQCNQLSPLLAYSSTRSVPNTCSYIAVVVKLARTLFLVLMQIYSLQMVNIPLPDRVTTTCLSHEWQLLVHFNQIIIICNLRRPCCCVFCCKHWCT